MTAPAERPAYETPPARRKIPHCSACGQVRVTVRTHQADGTHRPPGKTAPRRAPGCQICGSRDHWTKTHHGTNDRRKAIVRLTPAARRRRGLRPEPLGIARSSWLLNAVARPEVGR